MKILIIGPIPVALGGKEYGGVCTHIAGLSEELNKKGHGVTLWNYKPYNAHIKSDVSVIKNSYLSFFKAVIFGIPRLYSFDISYLSVKHKLMFVYQVYRLRTILKNNHFDVIHVHSLKNTVSIALKQISSEVPFVVTDHGFWNQKDALLKGSNTYIRVKKSIEACSKLIYISEYARNKHVEINLGQWDKMVKIKNPLNITDGLFVSDKNSLKKVIFFNGLTESVKIKNLPILLDAIEYEPKLSNSVKLFAIVNKEGLNYIKNRSYSFEMEVYERMPWKEVIELYKLSDVLVVPSKSDSFGLVYLEALMYGVPIIGLDKLVEEFQSDMETYIGERFDSCIESCHDLAVKMLKVLNTNEFNPNAVYNQLKNIYSWEHNVEKYEEVYKKVIHSRLTK